MSHRFNDLTAQEALIAIARQKQRDEQLMRRLEAIDKNFSTYKADPTLRAFMSRETGDQLTIDLAKEIYSALSQRLALAKHSHLKSHKRSPLLAFRHRNHWTGWAIRFNRQKSNDQAEALDWVITHKTAKPTIDETTTRFYDGNQFRGQFRRSTLVPGHAVLDLVCDCHHAYFDDVSMHVVMRDAAADLNKDTPKVADGRIYLRLPL